MSIYATCELCDRPGTDENPVGRYQECFRHPEVFAHEDCERAKREADEAAALADPRNLEGK